VIPYLKPHFCYREIFVLTAGPYQRTVACLALPYVTHIIT